MNGRNAHIALNMLEGIGPVTARNLESALGSLEAIFEVDKDELLRAKGVGGELASRIVRERERVDPEAEIERARRLGIRLVTPLDDEYPARLRDIYDPPLALYIWGELTSADRNAIAVVGTRRATHYGRECAERLSYNLIQVGFVVASGLARGIDTCAHMGALRARGRTIAVIGSGLDKIYPPENRDLAKEISKHGAVISEFALGRQADKTTFPIRNRIVSGLSVGVLVVEAGKKSGAMITATQALEQGRAVFAVPGRIDSYAARGPHALIRDGARLVEDIDDITDELEFLIRPTRGGKGGSASLAKGIDLGSDGERTEASVRLSSDEKTLVALLEEDAIDIDSLIRVSGLPAARVSSLLVGLEIRRVVRMLPGRMVELIRCRGQGVRS